MILLADIPTKIIIPPDLNMSDAAEITKVWQEIQKTARYINSIIDILEANKSKLDNGVYIKE